MPSISGLWLEFLNNQGFTTGSLASRQRAWLLNELSISDSGRLSIQGLWLQFLDFKGHTTGGLDSRRKSFFETELASTFPRASVSTVEAAWLTSVI